MGNGLVINFHFSSMQSIFSIIITQNIISCILLNRFCKQNKKQKKNRKLLNIINKKKPYED